MPLFLFILDFFYNIHKFIQPQYIHPSPFAEASLHILIACVLSGETSLWGRAENRTRACLTASRRAANWAMPPHSQLSHAAPQLPQAMQLWPHSRVNKDVCWPVHMYYWVSLPPPSTFSLSFHSWLLWGSFSIKNETDRDRTVPLKSSAIVKSAILFSRFFSFLGVFREYAKSN